MQLGRLEQVDVERILEVGGCVGGEEEHRPVVGEDARELTDMSLGVVEVFDEVGGTGPAEARPGEPQGHGVHLGHLEAFLPPAPGGRRDGLGAVVGPDHPASGAEEPGRLEALATAHVQHGPRAQSLDDRPVAGGVEGQQRVRGHALFGAFTGQPSARGVASVPGRRSPWPWPWPRPRPARRWPDLVSGWSCGPPGRRRQVVDPRDVAARLRDLRVVYTTDHSCRIPNLSLSRPRAVYRTPRSGGPAVSVAGSGRRAGSGPSSTTAPWPWWPSSPCWPPSPGWSPTTRRPISTWTRAGTFARRSPSGTRASGWAPSPTRTSATSCPWAPSTGCWPRCTCPCGSPSGSGWGSCCSPPVPVLCTCAVSWGCPGPGGT